MTSETQVGNLTTHKQTFFIQIACHTSCSSQARTAIADHSGTKTAKCKTVYTGTYIQQCNGVIYNQFVTSILCGDTDQTPTHFLRKCEALLACRQPVVSVKEAFCDSLCDDFGTSTYQRRIRQVKLLIDYNFCFIYPSRHGIKESNVTV